MVVPVKIRKVAGGYQVTHEGKTSARRTMRAKARRPASAPAAALATPSLVVALFSCASRAFLSLDYGRITETSIPLTAVREAGATVSTPALGATPS